MAGDLINGEIPDHWEFTTLGEVCRRGGGSIQTGPFGSQLHASDYVPAGVPSIMPTNIGENRIVEEGIVRITEEDANRLGQHRLRAGDIVYSRRGDVEKRALVREHEEGWLCGTGCLKVRLGSGVVDPLFASMYLGHPSVREWIVRHAIGATMPNLNTSIMSEVPFALPPLAEQKAIAAALGALDDKIELNRRMNATLEAIARALFQSWFVDFDPVRAKLDGSKPDGLDKATAALFPASFQDSPLGPIPQRWKVATLREISEVFSGGTPSKATDAYWNGNIPWISPKVMTGIHVNDSDDHVSEAAVGNGTRMVPKGAVLVMVRGMGLHQGVRISEAQRDVTFNQDVKAIVATTVPGTFLLYGLLHAAPMLLSKVHASGHGTGVLSTEFLDHLSFAVPSPEVLDFLSKPLAAVNSKIAANNSESRTLAALRDTLLPALLSGELSVDGVERKSGNLA